MATEVLELCFGEHFFEDCTPVCQHYHFPSGLIMSLNNTITKKSNSTSQYNFIMPLTDFEHLLKPWFIEKEVYTFIERFYDTKENNLMKRNIWFKKVQHHGLGRDKHANCVSFKRINQLDNGTIKYQERTMDLTEAMKIPGVDQLMKQECYEIDVQRTRYVHKFNENVILTLDRATFQDDSSFVVCSIIADVEWDQNSDPYKDKIHPCRSSIIELISKVKPDLYKHLVDKGDVKEEKYKSMSLAEFEAGPEEAEKRKEQAENELKRMEEENQYLDDDDKYSPDHIRMVYRCVLKYGLFPDDEDEDDE